MFNFGNKNEDDPQKALDKGRNVVNKGLMGGLTKAFMGQNFVDKANAAMDMGQQALNSQAVAQTRLEAMAEVLSIADTGTTINDNPIVLLTLKAITPMNTTFNITAQTPVSRIAIPRVGDKIKIKYNPADPSQIAVL